MKPIRFCRHATRRMKERGVLENETVGAIREPEKREPAAKGRVNAYRFVHGRFLRVTYEEEDNHILVITVTTRKKAFLGSTHED